MRSTALPFAARRSRRSSPVTVAILAIAQLVLIAAASRGTLAAADEVVVTGNTTHGVFQQSFQCGPTSIANLFGDLPPAWDPLWSHRQERESLAPLFVIKDHIAHLLDIDHVDKKVGVTWDNLLAESNRFMGRPAAEELGIQDTVFSFRTFRDAAGLRRILRGGHRAVILLRPRGKYYEGTRLVKHRSLWPLNDGATGVGHFLTVIGFRGAKFTVIDPNKVDQDFLGYPSDELFHFQTGATFRCIVGPPSHVVGAPGAEVGPTGNG